MQIVFPKYISYNCVNSVIKEAMKTFFIEKYNKGIFYNLDKFLYNILGSEIKCIDILIYAVNNAYIGKYGNRYVLDLFNQMIYPNTNYTLSNLLSLINSGNLEVKGTNIISICYIHIRHYVEVLYEIYLDKYKRR